MFISEHTRNIVIASFCMSLCTMANAPATSLQNVALAESTDIDLTVGYYAEVVFSVGALLAGLIFHPIYRTIGIKLTALLVTFLQGASYVAMIWIVNKWVIYVGYFLTGIGLGSLWILWPMVVVNNSSLSNSQRNMGWWFLAVSSGPFFGGLLNYFYLLKVTEISTANRKMVYGICTGIICLVAPVAAIFLTDAKKVKEEKIVLQDLGRVGEGVGMKNYEPLEELETDVDQTPSARAWFKKMAKKRSFWMLFLPLLYWGFIWGYLAKIIPTAIPSIVNERNLIPLSTLLVAMGFVAGSISWNHVARLTNNTFCVILITLMHVAAMTLSILIFPKDAATEILDVETAVTYIEPHKAYVIVISVLIGLADSCVSILYYTVAGKVYENGTSLGFSVNAIGFYVFYVISMFLPTLFDLHTYCYLMLGAVLVMCLALTVGLRKYL